MTAIDILNNFPYINSSDSSSWLYPPKFLRIHSTNFDTVFFGQDMSKEANRKETIQNLSPQEQLILEQELNTRGFTIDDMYHNKHRSDWQILFWADKMKNGVKR